MQVTGGLPRVLIATPALEGVCGGIQSFSRDVIFSAREICGPRRVRHIACPKKFGVVGKLDFLRRMLRAGLTWRPDVALVTHASLAPAAVGAKRLLVAAHGIEVWRELPSWKRSSLARADLILAVSRFTASRLTECNGIRPERVALFPNCVDTEIFCPGARGGRFLELLPEAYRGPILLSVARLAASEREKGLERLPELVRSLAGEFPGVGCIIAGGGDDRQRLEQQVRPAEASERIVFAGPVEESALPELYRSADVFVLPSVKEGFGIVFLEAMACGTPVVGLRAGGVPDALADGKLGWLADPHDPCALREAVVGALRADRSGPRIGAALHDAVKAAFGRMAFQDRLARALDGTLPPLS